MQQEEYLNKLDEVQRLAVEYIDGPSLVIAGAGAGKTRVLTSKIAYLIDNGINPWNILALTFTNKAAKEMRERIAVIVGDKCAGYLNMGTFHSVFSKILRKEAPLLGYTPNYTIYDRTDSTNLIKTIVKQMGLDVKIYKPSAVLSRISWAKNRMKQAGEYANDTQIRNSDASNNMPAIGSIYLAYQERLKTSDSMDFDDLLVQMYVLLTTHEEIRQKYARKFEFVLVDEYQDTNKTQAKILWLLTREREKLCVVGDDAQSIYAFRGADIENILGYTTVFPESRLFKLERNYRSTQNIVSAANCVIEHNRNRIPKNIYSLAPEGSKIKIYGALNDIEEADIITRNIKRINVDSRCRYNEIAILYRKNSQSRVIEESLRKSGIPYRVYGGLSFYERKEIKDTLAYFRLVVNHNDDEAFRRVVNYPARGIGKTTLEKIVSVATKYGCSLWNAVKRYTASEIGLSAATYSRICKFESMIDGFAEKLSETDAYSLGEEIIEKSGTKNEVFSDSSDISRKENIDELMTALKGFVDRQTGEYENEKATLTDYLAEVSLLTDADKNDDADKNEEKITLMTIHSAKGLEFDCVMIAGAEDEIIPGGQTFYNPKEIEEERRLFYVAITRAKKYCYISYAHVRFAYGSYTESEPSRFVKEINPVYVDCMKTGQERKFPGSPSIGFHESNRNAHDFINGNNWKKVSTNFTVADREAVPVLSATTKDNETIKKGSVVTHTRFGKGVVMNMSDAGDTVKVRIDFHDVGQKDLLLKFAPLTVLKK